MLKAQRNKSNTFITVLKFFPFLRLKRTVTAIRTRLTAATPASSKKPRLAYSAIVIFVPSGSFPPNALKKYAVCDKIYIT